MGPHLVWAFVVLCGFALLAWMWQRFTGATNAYRRIRALEQLHHARCEQDAVEAKWREAISQRVDGVEADLKPIKTKFSAGQFGAIGGGR